MSCCTWISTNYRCAGKVRKHVINKLQIKNVTVLNCNTFLFSNTTLTGLLKTSGGLGSTVDETIVVFAERGWSSSFSFLFGLRKTSFNVR